MLLCYFHSNSIHFRQGVTNKVCHFVCQVVNGKQELSKCSRYRLDVVRNLSAQALIPGRDINLTDLEQEGCLDGWSYSRDIYQSTIVSEVSICVRTSAIVVFKDCNINTYLICSSILCNFFFENCKCFVALLFLNVYFNAWLFQFDLVCSEQWKQPFTSTLYFLGVLVGSFFSGQLSDRSWEHKCFEKWPLNLNI